MPTRPLRSLLLLLAVPLWGCGDATGPASLGGLDPDAVTSAVMATLSPLASSGDALASLSQARPALEALGFEYDPGVTGVVTGLEPTCGWGADRVGPVALSRAGAAVSAAGLAAEMPAVARPLRLAVTPLPATVPPELAGSTLVYDAGQSGWVVAEGRAGAPETGVRVVWYEMDGTCEVADPSVEQGYAELVPVEHATMDALSVRVVETAGGSEVELVSLVQAASASGDTVWAEAFEVSGTYSEGTEPVSVDMSFTGSGDRAAGQEEYRLEVSLVRGDVDYVLVSEGSLLAGAYEDVLTSTVTRGGEVTGLELVLEGTEASESSPGTENVTGTVTHEGGVVADISVVGNNYAFSTPGGEAFSSSQANSLNAMFQTLLLTGFAALSRLPIFFL